jgi:gliding motility-associated-like protein
VFYNWTPASSPLTLVGANTSSPCVFGADSAGTFTYTLTVTDAFGCTDVDFVIVKVDDTASTPPSTNPILIICNFVTPNGDGNNDVWNIYDQNSTQTLTDIYPNNEVTVLNNHGQILYSKTGYTNDWKADGLTDGSYYYIVKINDIDKTYKGVLTVASSK